MKMNLENLGEYQIWSCKKIREIISELSDSEYEQEIEGRSTQSISKHIVMALETCFLYVEPIANVPSIYDVVDKESREDLLLRWSRLDNKLKEVLTEDIERQFIIEHMSDDVFTLDSKDFYMQYLLHTTYHRGQLTYLLRALGKDLPGTDYLFYFADKIGK